jgi:3-phytase
MNNLLHNKSQKKMIKRLTYMALIVCASVIALSILFNVEGKQEVEPPPQGSFAIEASQQTDFMPDTGDAADDPAIWLNQKNPDKSFVIGTNKKRGLDVYDMTGKLVFRNEIGRVNNVDLRSGINIGSKERIIVAASNKTGSRIEVLDLNPNSGELTPILEKPIMLEVEDQTYGFCMYHSHKTGNLFAFVNDKSGLYEQWQLKDNGSNKIIGEKVRSFRVGSQPEGCVADDANGVLFLGEEEVGLWKIAAEPNDSNELTLIDTVGLGQPNGGKLAADVEGMSLYIADPEDNKSGYLIVSTQGNDSYTIYERSAPHKYRGVITLSFEGARVGDTDGLDVIGMPVGSTYPEGMLVVQDGIYEKPDQLKRTQNFKYVSWQKIASTLNLK